MLSVQLDHEVTVSSVFITVEVNGETETKQANVSGDNKHLSASFSLGVTQSTVAMYKISFDGVDTAHFRFDLGES